MPPGEPGPTTGSGWGRRRFGWAATAWPALRSLLAAKDVNAGNDVVTTLDVLNMYEIFLARDAETSLVITEKRTLRKGAAILSFIDSDEFFLSLDNPRWSDRLPSAMPLALRDWAAGYLPLSSGGQARTRAAATWSAFYRALFTDRVFRRAVASLPPERQKALLRGVRPRPARPKAKDNGLTLRRRSYRRWIDAFDTLSPADIAWIARAGAATPRTIVGIHVLDADGVACLPAILRAWAEQIGVACSVRFVRGQGVSDEQWSEVVAALVPTATAFEERSALADLPPGTPLILCGGATLPRQQAGFCFADILSRPDVEACYADHDHVTAGMARSQPVFKPALSTAFMRRLPYAGASIAVRLRPETHERIRVGLETALAGDVPAGWARILLDGPPERVIRVPLLLFAVMRDPSPDPSPDPSLAVYEPVPGEGGVRSPPARPLIADSGVLPRVAIVIPTRDQHELLRECLDSIAASTDYDATRISVVVVDNASAEPETLDYLAELRATAGVTVLPWPGAFNFSAICNAGAALAGEADILVFLNNDTTVNRRDWLRALVEETRDPSVGLVGARLLYPDGTVQHGGVVLGVQGVGAHRMVGIDGKQADARDVTRDMVSMTGACLAVRRSVFAELGGFDPVLKVAFNDVDLCARAFKAGYRNIYVGEPLLVHHESKSRGLDSKRVKRLRSTREATYVRERHADLFRADPSYSPNLSLLGVGDLAWPPRVIPPWRRSGAGPGRVLILSRIHGLGHGVPIVVQQQASFLGRRGWEVTVGGPKDEREIQYEGSRRVVLRTAEAAAIFAVRGGYDCVIAHTPPFFSITRFLSDMPLVYFVDHGEPPPHLFADTTTREDDDWEKRFCAPLAKRVFTISDAISRQQYRSDATVVRNGNSHLACWSPGWAGRRRALRAKFGFEGSFVVLNVCRFGLGARIYKGVDRYCDVAADAPYLQPALAGRTRFILAGRGDEEDVLDIEGGDVTVYANVPDETMMELYAASDLYMNLSQWEGYNLGIGQARAMGLPVLASDIEPHREFPVETTNSIPDLCAGIARHLSTWDEEGTTRRAVVESWDEPLSILVDILDADRSEISSSWT